MCEYVLMSNETAIIKRGVWVMKVTSAMATQEGVVEDEDDTDAGLNSEDGVFLRCTCSHNHTTHPHIMSMHLCNCTAYLASRKEV